MGQDRRAISAVDIIAALAQRHKDDVFISECNMGSAAAGCRRMDAWAMRKSWAPWTTVGYEVKVSRADFLNDSKWPAYLPACHELYFACPPKLIDPVELPDGIGLMWMLGGGTGARLVTKRRAIRREPDQVTLCRLMAYALMSRARIVADMHQAASVPARDMWRAWLDSRKGDKTIGYMVGEALGAKLREAEAARAEAERRAERLAGVERALAEHGFDISSSEWTVRRRLSDDGSEAVRRARQLAHQIADTLDSVAL